MYKLSSSFAFKAFIFSALLVASFIFFGYKVAYIYKAYTTGVSIQDMIDNNMIPRKFPLKSGGLRLDLSKKHINSLEGLQNISDAEGLAVIALGGNALADASLVQGVFRPFKSLSDLYLPRNQLTSLVAGQFDGLDKLTTLSVPDNKLTIILQGAFDGLYSLAFLALRNNQLTHIDSGTFRELRKLKVLDLENNKLTDIEIGSFKDLEGLKLLRLQGNNLPDNVKERIRQEVQQVAPEAQVYF